MKKDFTILYLKKIIFSILFILILLGLVFIYSSSYYLSYINTKNCFYFLIKQIFGLLISFICMMFFSCIDEKIYFKYAKYLFYGFLFLCFLTQVSFIGIKINGAKRWINLLFFTFQPIEFFKPFYILYISKIISSNEYDSYATFINLIYVSMISSIVLLVQPDFGQTVILLFITLFLFILTHPRKNILYFFLILFLSIIIFLAISKPYRIKRLLTFLNPWVDPQGAGFQIIQSLIAIVNGGFTGVGIGKSFQKYFYLPMQHTDFIYSIICEEIGALGGIFIMLLFFNISLCICFIGSKIKNKFKSFYIYGISLLIMMQSSMNILVVMAALPTKGIGLPFISYGISSIVGFGIAFGIFNSFTLYNQNIK